MAKGKASKRVTAFVERPLPLGNTGIRIKIQGRSKRKNGEAYISVSGIHWRSHGKHKFATLTWRRLADYFSKNNK